MRTSTRTFASPVFSAVVVAALLWASPACVQFDVPNLGTAAEGLDDGAARSFLPSAISIDVTDLPASDSERQLAQGYRGLTQGARNVVDMFQTSADGVLAIGSTVSADLSDLTQTTVSGTFNVNGSEISYACDFAAFDFDGDGTTDGSGDSQTIPVAFRIWTDAGNGFTQFMCGLITSLPTEDSPGAGTVISHPFSANDTVPVDVQIRVEWDRIDNEHRWNQAYVTGSVEQAEGMELDIGYARVDSRVNDEGNQERTVRTSADFAVHPADFETVQSALHYVSRGEAILLSAEATGGLVPMTVDNLCLSLTDFAEATAGECDAFDTQDMTLLDIPIGGEADFPANFPATPTF